MSEGNTKKGTSGGLKGIILVVGLGLAFLVQKFTGIDIMAMLKSDKGTNTEQVSEGEKGDNLKQPSLPGSKNDSPKVQLPKENDSSKTKPEFGATQPKKQEETKQPAPPAEGKGVAKVRQSFRAMQSKVWVETEGTVSRLLRDDTNPDNGRHQIFLLRLAPDLQVKISHDYDDAGYLDGLKVGDHLKLQGRYEFEERGGVIHFTHRADRPTKNKPGGWIDFNGKRYQ